MEYMLISTHHLLITYISCFLPKRCFVFGGFLPAMQIILQVWFWLRFTLIVEILCTCICISTPWFDGRGNVQCVTCLKYVTTYLHYIYTTTHHYMQTLHTPFLDFGSLQEHQPHLNIYQNKGYSFHAGDASSYQILSYTTIQTHFIKETGLLTPARKWGSSGVQ